MIRIRSVWKLQYENEDKKAFDDNVPQITDTGNGASEMLLFETESWCNCYLIYILYIFGVMVDLFNPTSEAGLIDPNIWWRLCTSHSK